MLTIRDPADFYALPDHVQLMWLGHLTNKLHNKYRPAEQRTRKPGASDGGMTAEMQAAVDEGRL